LIAVEDPDVARGIALPQTAAIVRGRPFESTSHGEVGCAQCGRPRALVVLRFASRNAGPGGGDTVSSKEPDNPRPPRRRECERRLLSAGGAGAWSAAAMAALALGVGCSNYTESAAPDPHPTISFVGRNGAFYEAAVGRAAYVGAAIRDDRQVQCHDVNLPPPAGTTERLCDPVGELPRAVSIDAASCDDDACTVDDLGNVTIMPGGATQVPIRFTGRRSGAATLHATAHLNDGRVATGTVRLWFVTPVRLDITCGGAACSPPVAQVVGNRFGWALHERSLAEDGSEIQVAPAPIDVTVDGNAITVDPGFSGSPGPRQAAQVGRYDGSTGAFVLDAVASGTARVHVRTGNLERVVDVRVADPKELTASVVQHGLAALGSPASTDRPLGSDDFAGDASPFVDSWTDQPGHALYVAFRLADGTLALDDHVQITNDAPPAMRLRVDGLRPFGGAQDWSIVDFSWAQAGVVHFVATDGPARAEWTMDLRTK
jgi:hypothetical protein